MKPQRFHPLQEITPNNKFPWGGIEGVPAPVFGQIYRLRQYEGFDRQYRMWVISLVEFGGDFGYTEEGFDPVINTNELEKLLETIKEKATV